MRLFKTFALHARLQNSIARLAKSKTAEHELLSALYKNKGAQINQLRDVIDVGNAVRELAGPGYKEENVVAKLANVKLQESENNSFFAHVQHRYGRTPSISSIFQSPQAPQKDKSNCVTQEYIHKTFGPNGS